MNVLKDSPIKEELSFSGKNDYLIGISGKKGSGKDTFFSLLNKIASQRGVNFENRKFADALKQICSILSGKSIEYFTDRELYGEKIKSFNMTSRELMQKLGTEVLRDNFDSDIWVKTLFNQYRRNSNWVITDVRFPNEANAIKYRGGTLIRLERDLGDNDEHRSEIALDGYKGFDYIIDNNGTLEKFKKNVIDVVTDIGIR